MIWDDLTDKNQAQLLEKLFGKNRANVGAAILSNFETAQKAMITMENSAGSAEEEMAIAQDTITFKMNALGQTWVGVMQNLMDTSAIKGVIDILTELSGVIEAVTGAFGAFGTIGLAGGIFGSVKLFQNAKSIGSAVESISAVTKDIAKTGTTATTSKDILAYLNAAEGLTNKQKNSLLSGINDASDSALKLDKSLRKMEGMSISDVAKQIGLIGDEAAEATGDCKKFFDAFGGDRNKKFTLAELEKALAGENGLDAAKPLTNFIDKSEEAVKATKSLKDSFIDAGKGFKAYVKTIPGLINVASIVGSIALTAYSLYQQHQQNLITAAQNAGQEFNTMSESVEDYKTRIFDLKTSIESGALSEHEIYTAKQELLSIQGELLASYGSEIGQLNLLAMSADEVAAAFDNMTAAQAKSNLNENYKVDMKAVKAMENNPVTLQFDAGQASDEEIKRIVGKYEDVYLNKTGSKYTITVDADVRTAKETLNEIENEFKSIGINDKDTQKQFSSTLSYLTEQESKYGELYDNQIKWSIAANGSLTELEDKATDAAEKISLAYAATYDTDDERQKAIRDAVSYADTVRNEIDGIELLPEEESARKYLQGILDDVEDIKNLSSFESDLMSNNKSIMDAVDSLGAFMSTDGTINGYSILSFGEDYKAMSGNVVDGTADQKAAWESLTAVAEKYGITVEDALNIVASKSGDLSDALNGITISFEVSAGAYDAQKYFDSMESRTTSLTGKYTALSSAMSEQAQNGYLSMETYNSLASSIDGFSSCLDTNANGMVINAEKLRNLIDAQADELEKEVELQRQSDIDRYTENALSIAKLEHAYDSLTPAQQEELALLKDENSALSNTINSYNMLEQQIKSASSAYSKWQAAQSTPNQDEMFDNMYEAYKSMQELANNGDYGADEYKAAVEMLVPDGKDVEAYYKTLNRYLTEDDNVGFSNFMSDLEKNGFIKLLADDGVEVLKNGFEDGWDTSNVAEALGLTEDLVLSLFELGSMKNVEWPWKSAVTDLEAINAEQEKFVTETQAKIDAKTTERANLLDASQWASGGVDTSAFGADEVETITARANEYNDALTKFREISDNPGDYPDYLNKINEAYAELEEKRSAFEDSVENSDSYKKEYDRLNKEIAEEKNKIAYTSKEDNSVTKLVKSYRELTATKKKMMETGDESLYDGGIIAIDEAIASTEQKLSGLGDDIKERFYIDPSLFSAGIASVRELVLSYQEAVQTVNSMKPGTEGYDAAVEQMNTLREQVEGIDGIEAVIGVKLEDLDESILNGTFTPDFNVPVSVSVEGTGEVEAVEASLENVGAQADAVAKKRLGTLGAGATKSALSGVLSLLNSINAKKMSNKTVTITTVKKTVEESSSGGTKSGGSGKGSNGGTSGEQEDPDGPHASTGTSSAVGGKTLVGELGPEIVVSGSRYYIVGENGAEFVNLKRGDIVFNHLDTKKILNGHSGARGVALAEGTAMAGMNSGSAGVWKKPLKLSTSTTSSKSSTSTKSSSKSTSDSAKDAIEEAIKKYEEAIAELQGIIDLDNMLINDAFRKGFTEKIGTLTDEVIASYKDMQDQIHQEAEYYRSQGYEETSVEITALKKQWWEYAESISEAVSNAYEKVVTSLENESDTLKIFRDNAIDNKDLATLSTNTDKITQLYKEMQENIHNQAEYYRSLGYAETSDEISDLIQRWWDYQGEIKDANQQVYDYVVGLATGANEALDNLQGAFDTLKNAADEFAQSGGYLSVDTFQEILALEPKYLQYLQDENGQLKINRENMNKVIALKTEDLAISAALSYVERVRLAAEGKSTESLEELTSATLEAGDATWSFVYATLASIKMNDDAYRGAKKMVDMYFSLAKSASAAAASGVSDGIEEMREGMNSILEYTLDMLADQLEQQKDAISDMKDAYADIIDAKKESLELTKEENDYQKTIKNKLKEISKIQAKIDALSLDSSREAQAEKAKLLEDLAELQDELAEEQADKAYDTQVASLEKMQEAYETEKDAEIEALDKSASSYEKRYRAAIEYIESHWDTLYDELILWNTEYGSSLNTEITAEWEKATKALDTYGGKFSEVLAKMNSASTGDSLGDLTTISDDEMSGSVSSIVNQMYQNSVAWHRATSTSERSNLEAANLAHAKTLQRLGVNVGDTPVNGIWYADGQDLYSMYVSGYNPVDAKVGPLVAQMRKNSLAWSSANDAERANLSAANNNIANQIRGYGVAIAYNEKTGAWTINGQNIYDKYKDYLTMHTGGIVGGGDIKSNEQFALLKEKEWVLSEDMVKNLTAQIDMINRIGKSVSVVGATSRLSGFSKLMELDTNGALSSVNADNRVVSISIGDTTIQGADSSTVQKHLEINRDTVNQIAKVLGVKM